MEKKRYIGPVSLRPDSKKVERAVPVPVRVDAATQEDRKFKMKISQCVQGLRVPKETKQIMIKLLNEDFKAQFTRREFSPPTKRHLQAQRSAEITEFGEMQPAPKIVTEESRALQLTQTRHAFSKARNSLPAKFNSPKPILSQQGSPEIRFAPNLIKMKKFGGRFMTDTRRAFSLGVPVPPGPVP